MKMRPVYLFAPAHGHGNDLAWALYEAGHLTRHYVQVGDRRRLLRHYAGALRSPGGSRYFAGVLLDRFNRAGRKIRISPPATIPGRLRSTYTDVEDLRHEFDPDGAVIITYGTEIMPRWIYASAHAAINVHLGITPYYRGVRSVEWTLLTGHLNDVGYTLHHLSAIIDGGDVIAQGRVPVAVDDTPGTIYARVHAAAKERLLQIIPQLLVGLPPAVAPILAEGENYRRRAWYPRHALELRRKTPVTREMLDAAPEPRPLCDPTSGPDSLTKDKTEPLRVGAHKTAPTPQRAKS